MSIQNKISLSLKRMTPPGARRAAAMGLRRGRRWLSCQASEQIAAWVASEEPAPPPSDFEGWEPREFFRFEVLHQSKSSGARVGRIHTPHGHVDTPGYVAVATNAALKHVDHTLTDYSEEDGGQQLMFCNSYHLLLQPGGEAVEAAGGLHRFMNRTQPLITDSGGFQVFSLANHSVTDELNSKLNSKKRYPKGTMRVSEAGVVFRSYRDGKLVDLSPEKSVLNQKQLGADIIIPLDELPPFHTPARDLVRSVALTHRWEARSLRTHLADLRQQAMLGVIHGGISRELRTWSAEYISGLPFDGFAIGGSLGRDTAELMGILGTVMPILRADGGRLPPGTRKPVHLLGVGDEMSIRAAAKTGVDTFDSCFPTRLGRHGAALITGGSRINITNSRFKTEYRAVLDEECDCRVCSQGFSRAYLHHLFKAKEPLGPQLLAIHNLRYMERLMKGIRSDILNDML